MAAPAGGLDDAELREAQRDYLDFLDDEEDQGVYHGKVRDMISDNQYRLLVNINDLRRRNEKRASRLLSNAFEELIAFQRALKDFVASVDATYAKQYEDFYIGLEGSFGSKHVSPRTLTACFLSCIVCVEGIVTKCSLIRPKVVRSVHYCPATKKTIERRYTDLTSLDAFPSSSVYPTKDEENNPLETEFGLSVYKDHQTISIQEMPEKAPAGQLPRSVDVILDDDLVDKVKPGDRIQVVGTYRCLPGKKGGYTSGTFRTILIACHIKQMSKDARPLYSATDVAKIKRFSKSRSKDIFDQLARSLAPSIHGHEFIKKALLCMLLGGVEKVLENGSRIRGDINILLIGDPSVAKSQLLRYVLSTAPRAIGTTGRGSSGVGLTAAVTTDQETGMVVNPWGGLCKVQDSKILFLATLPSPAMPLGSSVEILATDDPDFAQEEEQELQVYEKHDDLLHGPNRRKEKIVSMEFMRKYIHVAKMIKPVLTQESADYIAEEYSRLRSQNQMNSDIARTSPVTARTLETLIRLSTAHAKARMSKTVDLQDAEAALELVQFAYFKKVLEKEKKRKKQAEDDSETEKEEEETQPEKEGRKQRRKKARTEGEEESYDPYDFSDTEQEMPEVQAPTPKTPEASATGEAKKLELADPRLKAFKAALLEVFKSSHAQSVGLKSVMESINRDNPEPFSLAEVKVALAHMQDDNQIMVSDDIIFLI
uniref:DNA replication licensing factor MCM3 n=2 Tax=Pavo cristatus TaxID=9049 RepID=A0A8C9FGX3_PAVCR